MRKFAQFLFRTFGWKIDENAPVGVKKAVIVVAPHTSNCDFIIGRLAFASYGIKVKLLIKKDLFFPPLGWILKGIGGIPVDRKKNNNITQFAVNLFEESEEMLMVFTPEGTRKRVDRWRSGFYWTAIDTGLPIVAHYIDYKTKTVGQFAPFAPTGDWEVDKLHFQNLYKDVNACHPENFNHEF